LLHVFGESNIGTISLEEHPYPGGFFFVKSLKLSNSPILLIKLGFSRRRNYRFSKFRAKFAGVIND
jgi:hypothetical protein